MNSFTNIVLPKSSIDAVEPLYISAAGFYDRISNHSIQRKRNEIPDEAIIIYCTGGEGWLVSDNDRFVVKPSMLLYCDKGVPHAYGANPDNPWQIYWAHFGGPFADYFAVQTGLSELVYRSSINNLSSIIPYMEAMLNNITKSTSELYRLSAYSALRLALLETLQQIIYPSHSLMPPMVSHTLRYMKNHLTSNLTLDQLAANVHLSRYHFIRQFKKHTGYSPMHYFVLLKTEQAKSLLLTTDQTVSQISISLNYNTAFYFSETFKRITGFSPIDYRKMHRRRY